MTALLSLFATSLVAALPGAMAPGSYLTLTISRTVRRGAPSASAMLIGHAILEAVLIAGFSFGLQSLLARPLVLRALALGGGVFLLWMGYDLLHGAFTGSVASDLETAERDSRIHPVTEGVVASISNPWWLLWWVTVGGALVAEAVSIGPAGVAAFYLGHQAADIGWYGFVIFAVSKGRHLLPPNTYRIIMAALAVFLLVLAVRFVLVGAGIIAVG